MKARLLLDHKTQTFSAQTVVPVGPHDWLKPFLIGCIVGSALTFMLLGMIMMAVCAMQH